MAHGSPNSFRRRLKLILKNADRNGVERRDECVDDWLRDHGLKGRFHTLIRALKTKISGRTLRRIGGAAKKQGKLASLFLLAIAFENGQDLRDVPFWNYHDEDT